MSPINIYKPRGFGSGFDHRFAKAFQPSAAPTGPDPNAGRRTATVSDVIARQHAFAFDPELKQHARAETVVPVQHAYGFDPILESGGT